MQDIESKAIQNYQDNMIYFEQHHPSIHNKLLALDTILNDGSYPQKYDLEYKDGYFDIVDLKTNNRLYNQDSILFSKELCENVNLKKNSQSFKTQRKLVFSQNTLDLYKTQDAYTDFISVAHIIDYYNAHSEDSMNMDKIDKYIFFGVGLGLHIEQIVTKFNIQISLIIEDDVELFRLSLFTTNYKEIFQNRTVVFSLAQNKNELYNSFNNFYLKAFFKNHFIKYSLFSNNYTQKIDEIRSLLISRPESTYSNERIMRKNKRVLEAIKNEYKFLNLRKKETEVYFKDKPWLVLGAGPSLHDNIEWLKQNHQNYIIIAAFASLKTLKKAGISPDIAVQIDETDSSTKRMLQNLGDLDFMQDTILVFSASVSKLLLDTFDKDKIYLHEDRTKYKLENSTLMVTSVGETIYSIALIFNPSAVYLLGLDFALSNDGKTHADDHFKSTKVEQTQNEDDDFQLSDNIIYIKGNHQDKVQTLPILALSVPVLDSKTLLYKSPEQNIYNLSQNGALFKNTIPFQTSDVKQNKNLHKNNLKADIQKIFDLYSTSKLTEEEIQEIAVRKEQITKIKEVLEIFRTSPHSNDDIFLRSYENFVTTILKDEYHYELWEVLSIFLLRVSSYIDDISTTPQVKNKKKHSKKLKQFLLTQLEKMILTYEKDLNILEATEVA